MTATPGFFVVGRFGFRAGDDGRFRLHWWTADATNGEVVPDPVEVAETRWVTPEEFTALTPVFDGDREFFERILPGL